MGDQEVGEVRPVSLQSKDHEDLLNVIDSLRSQGTSRYIDLPQLIVCGDQSSGKSSVLEAVSGVRFPRNDTLCTRFATELILRRGPSTSASVTITPHVDRPESESSQLLKFNHHTVNLDGFEALVNDAMDAMGIDGKSKAFSQDVLRVELSGPDQPHLTLVDLPGLFRSGNNSQSDEDAELIDGLVQSYMKNPRSIILAVVSAKNDVANQIVSKYARQHDPRGLRTLGIITKPDTLVEDSGDERAYVELAENKNIYFKLGWHVLMNRGHKTRNCSSKERDQNERSFFANGIWTSLPSSQLGITSLKPRLSSVLKEQILTEMPRLIEDTSTGIEECRHILNRLGSSRVTLQEQKLHLMQVRDTFSTLINSAVKGVCDDKFFGSVMDTSGRSKRLRAVTTNTCLEFAETMRHKGHTKEIVEDSDESPTRAGYPTKIRHADYVDEVVTLMKHSRGCELPGTYNPLIIGTLFYEQSKKWTELLDQYTQTILEATRATLNAILEVAADTTTADGLIRFIINPKMDALQHDLEAMVATILEPHRRGHPITYNHYFTETVQKTKAKHQEKHLAVQLGSYFGVNMAEGNTNVSVKNFDVKQLLSSLNQKTEADMDRYACSEAIDCMLAYYKVAMKTLVDNFATLAVEKCLLECLPQLLTSQTILALDDALISRIAAETEESQLERSRATEKLKVLESALVVLRSLDRHKAAATRDREPPSSPASSDGPEAYSEEEVENHETNGEDDHKSTALEPKPVAKTLPPLEPAPELSRSSVFQNGFTPPPKSAFVFSAPSLTAQTGTKLNGQKPLFGGLQRQ